ncbi:replication initiation protein [Acinetobacter pittii]|uniref:replication initiation protein RepM n=1 Tax=Acinetobacter pittii TaxID=48296 RepID=UPI000F735A2F|nr:replication initiation protein RepM [Acinetobacter pittii]EAM4439497.1 RepB family plasmid replication initiator protein [Salmonella enterica subsp. enterica serovar Give]EAU5220154.1 RepB family plasmid replication initiator protein [Salmonella enterica subsp. enterica serovar Oranienburg]RQL44173.1 RepB family plasmid replication initiator protein [Acinetobacter nosocomialis]MBJ8614220.1 replication initiation protein [Acinetobacter pittii]RSN86199.1 RepB family plasmid replication initia
MRDLVVKDNALINASYNLDLVEQRLILLAIVEARESGKGINANDPLEVHADSYINQFGVHRNTAYQALKDACKDLFARQFSYQEKKANGNIRNVMSRWVSQIAYNDNEATVDLIFAPAVVPFITRLEEQFTKYELQQVSSLSSAYAIRLYELLIQWRSTGKTPTIELQEFRKKLGVLDNEYLRMAHLKERVLELSIKQINEHTDITVKYEQHKRGRSISGFSFTFKQKKKDSPSIERDANTLELFSKMTDAQRHMFANKLSELPEMGRYSQGTESYQQFAVRIAEMLQDPAQFKELYPYLKKVGYMPSNKKDTVNG